MKATNINSNSRVLDIGCGPGNSTNQLSKTGASDLGLDFSQKMIDQADGNYPNLSFKQGESENIPEKNNTFEVVISNYVVHHLADPVKVFSEITRVLKQNGKFAFAVWGAAEEQSSIGAFFGAFMAHHEFSDLPHGPLYGVTDYETFQDLTEKGGLSNFELSNHKTAWQCKTLEPVIEGLWTWGNLSAFPKEKQDKIREDMIKNCEPFETEEGFSFSHSAIVGCAIKQ